MGALILRARKPAYQIAGEVGIAYTALSRYINEQEPISPKHMRALCAYFGVEPEDLVGRSNSDSTREGTPAVEGGVAR